MSESREDRTRANEIIAARAAVLEASRAAQEALERLARLEASSAYQDFGSRTIDSVDSPTPKRILRIKDIAEERGISGALMRHSPWLLPGFGKSEFEEGPRRWRRETVDAWYAVPLTERRAMWDMMDKRARRAVLT